MADSSRRRLCLDSIGHAQRRRTCAGENSLTRSFTLALSVLLPCSLVALLVALAFGSVPIPFADVVTVFAGDAPRLHSTLVLELRLPRALAAFAAGGLLGLAGALMQVLLRNPLADPYVLGLSGGASVGALLAMLAGLSMVSVSAAAFVGALLSTVIVFGLAHGTGSWTPTRLLLTGVVVAAGWGAFISFLLADQPNRRTTRACSTG